MPTPVKYFIEVAQKWGNIDPNDNQAIEDWFLNDFPNLPKKDLNAILDELLEQNNELSTDPGTIKYPSKVPLPLFKDRIAVPLYSPLAYSYKELINYIQNIIKFNKKRKT